MEAFVSALLQSTVKMAVPLLLASVGELVSQRAGVINVGLEGKILVAAFAAMAVAYFSGSPWAGVLAGVAASLLLAVLSGFLMVVLAADQVIVGTALNLLALGLTGVGYRAAFGVTGAALTVPPLPAWPLPWVSELPWVGPALFSRTVLGYLTALALVLVWFFLFRTRAGLRLRAVGENPEAADAEGVPVVRTRFFAVLACGAFAGLAGSYLSVVYARTFVEGMSAGRGFLALAIVVFGRWSPLGALFGALLFGMATALQFHFQALALDVPYHLLLAFPYAVTLAVLAVAGARGADAPRALGVPYARRGA
ncbi:MAG: ABC transporter permease [Candidatus Binatia bacterium]|nr:MAG: ABC transporter permease [Candidatus Binatia bacterium]